MLQTMISNESYIFLAVVTALALVALLYLLSPMSLLDDISNRGIQIGRGYWTCLKGTPILMRQHKLPVHVLGLVASRAMGCRLLRLTGRLNE